MVKCFLLKIVIKGKIDFMKTRGGYGSLNEK